jgi:hypothetical protein
MDTLTKEILAGTTIVIVGLLALVIVKHHNHHDGHHNKHKGTNGGGGEYKGDNGEHSINKHKLKSDVVNAVLHKNYGSAARVLDAIVSLVEKFPPPAKKIAIGEIETVLMAIEPLGAIIRVAINVPKFLEPTVNKGIKMSLNNLHQIPKKDKHAVIHATQHLVHMLRNGK